MTFSGLFEIVLLVCDSIVVIAVAISWIHKGHKALKAPNALQDERIAKLEKRMDEFDHYFKNDKLRLQDIEEGSKVTQRAILALLAHSIDGDDIDSLKKAKDDLQTYLINK